MTKVISGFPGVGKTAFQQFQINSIDSDSSQFSWIREGERNPDFPRNYMQHIRASIGQFDFVLVSSHDVVREALRENGIEYTLVYPSIELKEEYLKRYELRSSPRGFIEFMSANWESFIKSIESETFPELVKLKSGQYLSDALRSQHAQKAKVGDVVQSKRDGRIQFAVGYVGAEYAFSDPMKRVGSWMLEHGDYVIVRSGAEATKEQP